MGQWNLLFLNRRLFSCQNQYRKAGRQPDAAPDKRKFVFASPTGRPLAEIALAHAVKGSAEAPYWRDDALEKRPPMMEAWARFCVPKPAKVTPFRAA